MSEGAISFLVAMPHLRVALSKLDAILCFKRVSPVLALGLGDTSEGKEGRCMGGSMVDHRPQPASLSFPPSWCPGCYKMAQALP